MHQLRLVGVAGAITLCCGLVTSASAQESGQWVRGDARVVGGTTGNYTSNLGPSGGTVAVTVQTNGGDVPGQALLGVEWESPPGVMAPSQTVALQVAVRVDSLEYEGNLSLRLSPTVYRGDTYLSLSPFAFVDMSCTSGACSTTPPAAGLVDFSLGAGSRDGEVVTFQYAIMNCSTCVVEWDYTWTTQATPLDAADDPPAVSDSATAIPPIVAPEYGVIERDGNLFLVSPPDGTLSLTLSDLPEWARAQMVTVGAVIANVGPPDSVATGDPLILLDGKPVARLHDATAHGGVIVEGSETIFINGVPAAFAGCQTVCPLLSGGLVPHVGGPILGNCELERLNGVPVAERRVECMDEWTAQPMTDAGSGFGDDEFSRAVYCGILEARVRYDPVVSTVTTYLYGTLCSSRARWELRQRVEQGSTVLEGEGEGFEVGDALVIGSDADRSEVARVAGKGSIILDRPLQNSYPAGTLITRVPDEYAELVPSPSLDVAVRDAVEDGPGDQTDGALVCGAASLQDGPQWVVKSPNNPRTVTYFEHAGFLCSENEDAYYQVGVVWEYYSCWKGWTGCARFEPFDGPAPP